MNTHVLLLREASDSEDKYEAAFRSKLYVPVSIPVLEPVTTNQDELRRLVNAGPSSSLPFAGVIVTSSRASHAWEHAIASLSHDSSPGWSSVPFYVVGTATERSLREIRNRFPSSSHSPVDIRGAASGNAKELAQFILDDQAGSKGRLLYLTGDKNRDTLPNILDEGGIQLTSLKVYETLGSTSFSTDLKRLLDSHPSDPSQSHWWIVYFAPSSAIFTTPFLSEHFDLPSESDSQRSRRSAQIASIGPTTTECLSRELGLRVDVTASKPNPSDLLEAIKSFDDSHCIVRV